jgi:hypothetical protein
MKKFLWLPIFLLINLKVCGQIKIDLVGDTWVPQVEQALELIENTDINTYNFVLKHCKKISFWNGEFSTVEGNYTITISQGDMKLNSVENIACILVHESKHLEIIQSETSFSLLYEEYICYLWELQFIEILQGEPEWIKENCLNMIYKLEP